MMVNTSRVACLALIVLFAGGADTAVAQIHFQSYGSLGGRAGVLGQTGRGNRGSTGDVFSPDSQYLVRRPDERTLELRSLNNDREAIAFEHAGAATFCRFSPDAGTLAVAVEHVEQSDSSNCEVVLWEVGTHTCRHHLERGRRCLDLQFTRDGRLLVISSTSLEKGDALNKTAVWDVETGRQSHELQIEDPHRRYSNPIASLDQVSPDGHRLAACGFSGVSIWDTRYWGRSRLFGSAGAALPGCFSPDSRLFAATHGTWRAPTAFFGDGLAIWDIDQDRIVAELPVEHAKNDTAGGWPVFAPDGKSLAATVDVFGKKAQMVRAMTLYWDFSSGKQAVLQTSLANARYCSLCPPTFSPDGKTLAYLLWQPPPTIQLIDVRILRPLQKLEMKLSGDLPANPASLPPQVFGVWFSPDGRWLAAARSVAEIRECEVFIWSGNVGADHQIPQPQTHESQSATTR